jgi:hypothetical protein
VGNHYKEYPDARVIVVSDAIGFLRRLRQTSTSARR